MNTKMWKSVVIAALFAVLTAVFLLVAAVMLCLRAEDPEKQIGIWILPILAVGAAVASLLCRRLCKEKAPLAQMASGGLYLLVLGAAALPFGGEFSAGSFFLKIGLVMAICVLTAFWGGSSHRADSRRAAKRAVKIYKGKR